jgi:hypothetical protein
MSESDDLMTAEERNRLVRPEGTRPDGSSIYVATYRGKQAIQAAEARAVAAGKLIDPRKVDFRKFWVHLNDPYGVLGVPVGLYYCLVGVRFVRGFSADMWIDTRDLPEDTREEFFRLAQAGYYYDLSFLNFDQPIDPPWFLDPPIESPPWSKK